MSAIFRHCRVCRALPGAPCISIVSEPGRVMPRPHCERTIEFRRPDAEPDGDHSGWIIHDLAGYRVAYERAVLELVGFLDVELFQ